MEPSNIAGLMEKLDYQFKEEEILKEALRHSSYVNEQPCSDMRDNERFEFLGDAVLSLAISEALMRSYPNAKEGPLSKFRASLVNEERLARIARLIDLGSYIYLGRGEILTDGRDKQSILANTFEALIAAIYLDGSFETARRVIRTLFSSLIKKTATEDRNQDYKSQLQEWIQSTRKTTPCYRVAYELGPDHNKMFCVQVKVDNFYSEGFGRSKKLAEQQAAGRILEILKKHDKR